MLGVHLHAENLAASAVQVAHDITLGFLRGDNLHLHNRFEQNEVGFFAGFLDCKNTGHLEGQFVGIDLVIGSIDHLDPDIDQRVSGQHTTGDGLADAGLHGVVIFLRDNTTDDLVLDLDALTTLVRCDVDDRVAVLTTTAGLADELAFALCRGSDGFAVGNLRSTHGGLPLELAQHAVADDVQMQLTHAGNDQLAGLFVGEHPEGRVFLGKSLQRLGHLFAVAAGVGLHGHRDHWFGESRRL